MKFASVSADLKYFFKEHRMGGGLAVNLLLARAYLGVVIVCD